MAIDRVHLDLQALQPSQYRQVAEWKFDARGEGWDWDRYSADMERPNWAHFAIYQKDDFVGCVSLEKLHPQMAAYHIVTARRRVHPEALADMCIRIAGYLFLKENFTAVCAHNPIEKRAGARLAIRCGMREIGHSETTRFFIITKQTFAKNGWFDR